MDCPPQRDEEQVDSGLHRARPRCQYKSSVPPAEGVMARASKVSAAS
jgi:hypothetical protein